MTIEDLLVAPRIADPQLSPDGRTVLFVQTTTDGKTGRRNARHLDRRRRWSQVSRRRSSPARRARTRHAGRPTASTSRFSPIGTVRRRYTSPMPTAAACRKVTSLAEGRAAAAGVVARRLAASHSSRTSFLSAPTKRATRRSSKRRSKNPVKVHRLTRLLYRHWDEWRENIRHHVFVATIADGRARDVTPGDYDSPPTQQEDAAIAFSPDGATMAFVSNREGNDEKRGRRTTTCGSCRSAGGEAEEMTSNAAAGPAAHVLARRTHAVRSRAAARRIRIGSLVSRRVRRRGRREADAVSHR